MSWGAADRLPHAAHTAPAETRLRTRGAAERERGLQRAAGRPPLSPCPSYQTPQPREQPLRADGRSPRGGRGGRSARPGRPPARSDRIYRRRNPLRAPLAEPGRASHGITGRACAAAPPGLRGMRAPRSRCCRSRPSARANQGAAGTALPNPHVHRDLTELPGARAGGGRGSGHVAPPIEGARLCRVRQSRLSPRLPASPHVVLGQSRGSPFPSCPSASQRRRHSGPGKVAACAPRPAPYALGINKQSGCYSNSDGSSSTLPLRTAFWLRPSCINSLCVYNLRAFKTLPMIT